MPDHGVDLILNRLNLRSAERRMMGEVEPQPRLFDQRTLLRDMVAQNITQRGVQKVCRGMVRHDATASLSIDNRINPVPDGNTTALQSPDMHVHITCALDNVANDETPAISKCEDPMIARLSAAFGIKRRRIEHQFHRVAMVRARYRPAVDDHRPHLAASGQSRISAEHSRPDLIPYAEPDIAGRRVAGRKPALARRLLLALQG